MNNFFDEYPAYYKTGFWIEAHPNRLNTRYKILIEENKNIIKNARILDMACHDGRFSFAALKHGAKHVVGIEARQNLIDSANANMKLYGIPENKYKFIVGDIHKEIEKLLPRFDLIFCMGFFYHTMHHFAILSEIKRLQPKFVIFDTKISRSNKSIIELTFEKPSMDWNAVAYYNSKSLQWKDRIIVGNPSREALNTMLNYFDFEIRYVNWHSKGIKSWIDLEDYRDRDRVTIIANDKPKLGKFL